MRPKTLLSPLLLLAIWVPVLAILELEWRLNAQYQYGYFVPFFTLYLLFLRWEDRPPASPGSRWRMLVPFLALGYMPLQVIHTANPDWRLIYAFATLLAVGITLVWLAQIGGRKWVRHFAPALAMIFFAVPWMTGIENRITSSLMEIVSAFTVEVLNLAGIYAVRTGNVILLQGAVVGVEEACSGVRSFQSALMAGYLFGELLRFRLSLRFLLIALGAAMNFALNLARTLTLTLISLNEGQDGFETWHDWVGNGVAIGGFLSVAGMAWLIHRGIKGRRRNVAASSPPETETAHPGLERQAGHLPAGLQLTVIAFVFMAYALDMIWYRSTSTPHEGFPYHAIQWNALSDSIEAREMDPITVAQLKFSEGTHRIWTDPQGIRWTAFYFNWQEGRISSHAGIHRPENCLPAAGVSLTASHEDLIWQSPEGYQIPFQSMTFTGVGGSIHVFFAVWDENGAEPWLSTTWKERLSDVFHRRVVKGRHSVQFLAENASSLQQAKAACLDILDRMYATP